MAAGVARGRVHRGLAERWMCAALCRVVRSVRVLRTAEQRQMRRCGECGACRRRHRHSGAQQRAQTAHTIPTPTLLLHCTALAAHSRIDRDRSFLCDISRHGERDPAAEAAWANQNASRVIRVQKIKRQSGCWIRRATARGCFIVASCCGCRSVGRCVAHWAGRARLLLPPPAARAPAARPCRDRPSRPRPAADPATPCSM